MIASISRCIRGSITAATATWAQHRRIAMADNGTHPVLDQTPARPYASVRDFRTRVFADVTLPSGLLVKIRYVQSIRHDECLGSAACRAAPAERQTRARLLTTTTTPTLSGVAWRGAIPPSSTAASGPRSSRVAQARTRRWASRNSPTPTMKRSRKPSCGIAVWLPRWLRRSRRFAKTQSARIVAQLAEKYHVLPHQVLQTTPAEFYLNLLLAALDTTRRPPPSPPPQARTAEQPSLLAQFEAVLGRGNGEENGGHP